MANDVTTAEAAEILNVTPRQIRWYYAKGLLEGRRIVDRFSRGPLLVFRRRDVERFQKPVKTGRPKVKPRLANLSDKG